MDRKAIIQKYKDLEEETVFHVLADDRLVVGEEVDDSNMLYYVIRDGDIYTVESAWNQPILSSRKPETPEKIVTKLSHDHH